MSSSSSICQIKNIRAQKACLITKRSQEGYAGGSSLRIQQACKLVAHRQSEDTDKVRIAFSKHTVLQLVAFTANQPIIATQSPWPSNVLYFLSIAGRRFWSGAVIC